MLATDIVDQGTINTTLPDTSDPMYQPAAFCLFLRQQFAALRTTGFQFQKAQISDLTTYGGALSDWLDDAAARESDIIANGVSELTESLPDILAIGAAYMSGGATAAIGCVVNVALKRLLGGDQGAEAAYNQGAGSQIDFDDVIDKLEEIRVQIEKVFTDYNINIINSREDAFFSMGPPAD